MIGSLIRGLGVLCIVLELAEDGGTCVCPELGVHFSSSRGRVLGAFGVGIVELVVETLLPDGPRFWVVELLGGEAAGFPKAVNLFEFGTARRVLLPVAGFGDNIRLLWPAGNGTLAGDLRGLATEDDVGVFAEFAVQRLKGGF